MLKSPLPCLIVFAVSCASLGDPAQVVTGDVRIQLLSPTLVRIEQRGPNGFEDRATFTVVERDWLGAQYATREEGGFTFIQSEHYTVRVATGTKSAIGVQVLSSAGDVLYEHKQKMPEVTFFPSPGRMPPAYVMPDSPRVVPPAWGATPPPDGAAFPETSGWDIGNDAPDVYVFVNAGGGYAALRKEFLKLTGPIAMPPLYAFGLFDSRFHPYTEQTALETIDTYRQKGIPLDVFVVDTDWRVGASHGYEVNKELFPDMGRFIREAHDRHLRLMFNDHPEPISEVATDPAELRFRWEGLTKILGMGADVWWYDRNWGTVLREPAPGLHKEVWGMRLYHDMTQRFRPERRPLIMTNVQGIDNGILNYPSSPAAHRYPIWWTGDTGAQWDYLRRGIENGVSSGVISMLPYVNEDLGGHWGSPTPELYVRFVQFGCLSPVTRLHCTRGQTRYPWVFGPEVEQIVSDYTRLRYRLLPTIYAAARRAYDDGTPLLRRCDLEWPQFAEAADGQQYLFGDDILVAPMNVSELGEIRPVPGDMLWTEDGQPGLKGEYFDNQTLSGAPAVTRVDETVAFDWGPRWPMVDLPQNNFSVRWTGKLGPVPVSGVYTLATTSDDGSRLWVNGEQVVDAWRDQSETTQYGEIELEAGRTYDVRLEYYENSGDAVCRLGWSLPSEGGREAARNVWLPPGEWEDLWTGDIVAGPKTTRVQAPLERMPMWVRRGGLVLTAPQAQYTAELQWDRITVEAFPPATGEVRRELYEDDGISPDYQMGAFARTALTLTGTGEGARLAIAPVKGPYGGVPASRTWTMRFHLRAGQSVQRVTVNGRERAVGEGGVTLLAPSEQPLTMSFLGAGTRPAAGAGPVIEVVVTAPTADGLTVEVATKEATGR
jgi:alpha-glucosidase (family GH31 glycosyl hydrolase)